jgi:hypothetical protein
MAPAAVTAKDLVLSAVEEHTPKPIELLNIFATQLSYVEIQDAVSELLESGAIELASNQRLRFVGPVSQ